MQSVLTENAQRNNLQSIEGLFNHANHVCMFVQIHTAKVSCKGGLHFYFLGFQSYRVFDFAQELYRHAPIILAQDG